MLATSPASSTPSLLCPIDHRSPSDEWITKIVKLQYPGAAIEDWEFRRVNPRRSGLEAKKLAQVEMAVRRQWFDEAGALGQEKAVRRRSNYILVRCGRIGDQGAVNACVQFVCGTEHDFRGHAVLTLNLTSTRSQTFAQSARQGAVKLFGLCLHLFVMLHGRASCLS